MSTVCTQEGTRTPTPLGPLFKSSGYAIRLPGLVRKGGSSPLFVKGPSDLAAQSHEHRE